MSKLYFKNKPIIGLEISQTSAKVMAVSPGRRLVLGYGSIELDPAKMTNSSDMAAHLKVQLRELLSKNVVGKLPSNHTMISVPTARTFTRSVTLPRSAEANLSAAIELEAEQYIPVAINELYIDQEIIETNDEEVEVLLSAVPKLHVDALIDVCNDIGLNPLLIEPSIASVARLVRAAEEGSLATIILDIGAEGTDIAILDKTVRVTGGIDVGGHSMTDAIMKKMNLTHEAAHMVRTHNGLSVGPKQEAVRSALKPCLTKIIDETRKIIRYYSERLGKETKLEQLIIVGGGSNIPGIGDYFTENMIIPARVASPWQILDFGKLTPPSKQMKPRFITSIGLALIDQKELWQ